LFLLYFYFKQILNNILLELNLVTKNMEIILNYIKSNKDKIIDINYLLNLIDNIIMIKKIYYFNCHIIFSYFMFC
jgi:hypothetical protein